MRPRSFFVISILFASCVQLFAATVTVKISSPTNAGSTTSPVHLSASATASPSRPITGWWVYVDNVGVYQAGTTPSINTDLSMSPGTHTITVRAWSKGVPGSASLSTTVSSSSSPIAVTISPNSASIQTGLSQQFTGSVTGTTNTGLTWWVNGVQGGNSTVGTISSTGAYNAPATVPSGGSATVTAKSQADSTKSASAAVTITTAPTAVRVSISPTSATVQTGQSKQFTAAVTGTTNTGVTWLVNGTTGGSSSVGNVSASGLYSAPMVVPTGSVTVTAKSNYDSSSSANAAVSVSVSSTGQVSGVTPSAIMMKSAKINWTTATPTTSQVEYGTTSAYGSSTSLDSTANTNHAMSLLGLSANTPYHYRVKSQDSSGNTFYSNDATFTTALWSADHETGDLSEWTISGPKGSGGMFNSGTASAVASPDHAHSGTYALKATISGSSAVRMFRWNETYQNPTMYYSAWYYFPQRYQATAGWWNIMQWKSVTQANNCNLSMSDPFYVLDVHNRADGTMYLRLYNWQAGFYHEQTLKNINVGQWVHVQAYYKAAGDNTGQVTIWQDGVQIIDVPNVQTRYTGGCYAWSVDNYSGGLSPNPATIYADDVSISLKP